MAHLLDRLADAGELGVRGRRDRRVVEADDGDVVGDAAAGGGEDGQGAGGHQVGRGEDGVDVRVGRPAAASIAAAPPSWVKSPMRLEARVGAEAGLGEGVAVAGEPVDARRPCPAGR